MILVLDPKDNSITPYKSLKECVRHNPEFSYQYLRRVKQSCIGMPYKGYLVFRINHTKL
jgi:hypothetical protein